MGIKRNIITDFSSGTPSSTYSIATGYSVGSEWVNTNNGNRFYHKTDGNWVLLNVDSPFYLQGSTSSAFDTTSAIYRTGNIGIGLTGPSTKLHIFATQSGAFRLEDGTQSYPGYVLTSDANGVGTWQVNTWQVNTQVRINSATATALPTWNNTTIMCERSGPCTITIPDTGLPPNFSFRFIVISGNTSATLAFTYSSPAVSILPNTLLTFAQYESGVIDRLGTSSNYYITF